MTGTHGRANEGKFACELFDANYYLDKNPDVRRAGVEPLKHYLGWGQREGRAPNSALEPISGAVKLRSEISETPLDDIVGLLPESHRSPPSDPVVWERLRTLVQPRFYGAQLDELRSEDVDNVFDHYLSTGVFHGLRVTFLFHPGWYLTKLERQSILPPRHDENPFFHWLTIGWEHLVVPTPLFDEDYYLERHRDLRRWRAWPFLHYAQHGCYEPGRRPSSVVSTGQAAQGAPKAERVPILLPELLAPDPSGTHVDLRQSSPLEDLAVFLSQKVERLRTDKYRDLIAKAADIEPLVCRPYGAREAIFPPFKHPLREVKNHAERIREDLAASHYDTIVLAPHCRMAGSARVTGALTHALRAIDAESRAIVLTTDLSDFERPDWFHPDFRVFDFSARAGDLTQAERVRLLLDVVRGLTPRRIINVNSRLGWELYKTFGKQLATLTELSAYMFTWDLDAKGNKGGYPIDSFYQCFGFLSWVLVDNSALRNELVKRYALSRQLQAKLFVALTPVSETSVDHSSVFERRRHGGRSLRTVWAGRFDRQKRFDVVVEIAERMPELEIWAWGKPVLGGLDVNLDALPPNITLQGTYQHFDDLPFEASDFFLYTSEWDGLPTVLLDAGARGVPTVASSVGGVRDVLDDSTGFPVFQALDPEEYVQAIKLMISDPAEATRRAQAFKSRVASLCASDSYTRVVASAMAATQKSREDLYGSPDSSRHHTSAISTRVRRA